MPLIPPWLRIKQSTRQAGMILLQGVTARLPKLEVPWLRGWSQQMLKYSPFSSMCPGPDLPCTLARIPPQDRWSTESGTRIQLFPIKTDIRIQCLCRPLLPACLFFWVVTQSVMSPVWRSVPDVWILAKILSMLVLTLDSLSLGITHHEPLADLHCWHAHFLGLWLEKDALLPLLHPPPPSDCQDLQFAGPLTFLLNSDKMVLDV